MEAQFVLVQEVPETPYHRDFWIATAKPAKRGLFGNRIIKGSWYQFKLLNQDVNLPQLTSSQWCLARAQLQQTHPEVEKTMAAVATGKGLVDEWVDSLIAHPNLETGEYASNLNPRPKSGKVPLLIEGAVVQPSRKGFVIDQVYGRELPGLGYLDKLSGKDAERLQQSAANSLGLKDLRGAFSFGYYDKESEGLRALALSCYHPYGSHEVNLDGRSPSYSGNTFRPMVSPWTVDAHRARVYHDGKSKTIFRQLESGLVQATILI